jgi:peptidyl-prolyl cis-trans isomerase A (cyclophilin A)
MTRATIETDKGAIEIELHAEGAPKATANFIELARKGYYDGVVFHRLVPDFVIQGGDGEYGHIDRLDRGRLGTGGPGYKFADEPFEGDYVRGAVAMANAGPNTNGSQFFITEVPTPHLTRKHTIFGEVVQGFDIVGRIARVPKGPQDRPATPVVINKVTIGRR